MTRHLQLGSEFEPLIKNFATFVVDQVLETHERSFNQSRERWESTVDVLVQNSVNQELSSAIRSSLTPVLVRELREALTLGFQDDLQPKLANTITTTLTELVGDKLAPELAAQFSVLLQSELRQLVASEFKSFADSAIAPALKLILQRQVEQQAHLKRISWLFGILTVFFLVFEGVPNIRNLIIRQFSNPQTQTIPSNFVSPYDRFPL